MSEQENVNIVQQMDTDFRQGNVPGEQKVELSRLGAFEWFAGLNEEDLAEISLACEECTVQPGTIIGGGRGRKSDKGKWAMRST